MFWNKNRKIRKCGLAYKLEKPKYAIGKNVINNVKKRYI